MMKKIIIGVVVAIVVITLSAIFVVMYRQNNSMIGGGMMISESPAMSESFGFDQRTSMNKQVFAIDMIEESGSITQDSELSSDRLIIKTGYFSIVVSDVNSAVEAVSSFAIDKGGFLVSRNTYKEGLAPYATVVVRVPSAVFDEGINNYKSLGDVKSEHVTGSDVTEEYVDLDAQLRNLRATEDQFLKIMNQAIKIEDILAVQRELSYVRGNIERIEGRMKYLRQSADLSTITVNLSTDPAVLPAVDKDNQWKPLAEVKAAIRALVNMAKTLTYVLIWIVILIPLWTIIALIIWLFYRFVLKRFINTK